MGKCIYNTLWEKNYPFDRCSSDFCATKSSPPRRPPTSQRSIQNPNQGIHEAWDTVPHRYFGEHWCPLLFSIHSPAPRSLSCSRRQGCFFSPHSRPVSTTKPLCWSLHTVHVLASSLLRSYFGYDVPISLIIVSYMHSFIHSFHPIIKFTYLCLYIYIYSHIMQFPWAWEKGDWIRLSAAVACLC